MLIYSNYDEKFTPKKILLSEKGQPHYVYNLTIENGKNQYNPFKKIDLVTET